MLTSALAVMAFGLIGPEPPLHCPATLAEITGAPAIKMEYAGALFGTCCGGCDAPFAKDPVGLLAKAAKANTTVGLFGYDPVSGRKIDAKNAVAYSDYRAIRYCFASADEKKAFDVAPGKFLSDVKAEAYMCPVTGDEMTPESSRGYADYKGVRYYLCCPQCTTAFRKDPAKFADSVASAVKPLAVMTMK
ncbi:MAG: YHS domain-containing protein [Fimbriimonadales bacterium]